MDPKAALLSHCWPLHHSLPSNQFLLPGSDSQEECSKILLHSPEAVMRLSSRININIVLFTYDLFYAVLEHNLPPPSFITRYLLSVSADTNAGLSYLLAVQQEASDYHKKKQNKPYPAYRLTAADVFFLFFFSKKRNSSRRTDRA